MYTNLFIVRFVSLLCLRSTLRKEGRKEGWGGGGVGGGGGGEGGRNIYFIFIIVIFYIIFLHNPILIYLFLVPFLDKIDVFVFPSETKYNI